MTNKQLQEEIDRLKGQKKSLELEAKRSVEVDTLKAEVKSLRRAKKHSKLYAAARRVGKGFKKMAKSKAVKKGGKYLKEAAKDKGKKRKGPAKFGMMGFGFNGPDEKKSKKRKDDPFGNL